ncbi:hypothetical protein V493_07274 [Pseudogymnoascus sp. VKM F-4281 (FW-2241)]|nr:hypothetical protein V493_07274 [Pseudogymnoascus sp. VKM F-4281 (FW-2241)]
MLFTRKTALWLAILPSALAIECTFTNAIDVSSVGGSGGGSSGDSSTCLGLCGTDATCLELCEGNAAAIGAIKVSNDETARNSNVVRRATLDCTSSETCFTDQSLLLCLDPVTGTFHDSTGGSGDINTGVYTPGTGTTDEPIVSSADSAGDSTATTVSPSDSESTSAPVVPSDSVSTSAPALPSPSDTETEDETETETEAPVDGTPTKGVVVSNTSAPKVTATSGVDRLSGHGAVVGALGLLDGKLSQDNRIALTQKRGYFAEEYLNSRML